VWFGNLPGGVTDFAPDRIADNHRTANAPACCIVDAEYATSH